jgi:hypothetical protein
MQIRRMTSDGRELSGNCDNVNALSEEIEWETGKNYSKVP